MTLLRRGNTKSAVLSAESVLMIRRRYASGLITQGALAREYGVGVTQIGRIVREESWRDVAVLPPGVAYAGRPDEPPADLDVRAAASAAGLSRLLAEAEKLPNPKRDLEDLRGGAPATSHAPSSESPPAAGAADSEGAEASGGPAALSRENVVGSVLPPFEEPAEPSKGE